jgi:hypothetical protein
MGLKKSIGDPEGTQLFHRFYKRHFTYAPFKIILIGMESIST